MRQQPWWRRAQRAAESGYGPIFPAIRIAADLAVLDARPAFYGLQREPPEGRLRCRLWGTVKTALRRGDQQRWGPKTREDGVFTLKLDEGVSLAMAFGTGDEGELAVSVRGGGAVPANLKGPAAPFTIPNTSQSVALRIVELHADGWVGRTG